MKFKIGPVEVLFAEYKKSPKNVEKYLAEKSKFIDLTLKNLLAGKTM